jgi:hypothetical protein
VFLVSYIVRVLEQIAAGGGCVVDTRYEALFAWWYGGLALRYAGQLSDCARTFFGV